MRPSGSLTSMAYWRLTGGGWSPSPGSGWTARFISSTTRRRTAGSMWFRFRISATLLTSIFGMGGKCGFWARRGLPVLAQVPDLGELLGGEQAPRDAPLRLGD